MTKLALSQTKGPVDPITTSNVLSDDTEWAKRADYWGRQKPPKPRNHSGRKDRQPLILSGHGVRLSVDRDTLLVQNGFTHYPQQRKEWRFFASERRRLPARIVILDGSGGLSFDVMAWLANLKIPLVQINWKGEVVTMLGGTGHSADSRMVEAQRTALHNGEGFQLAVELIRDKITGCMETWADGGTKPRIPSAKVGGRNDMALEAFSSNHKKARHQSRILVNVSASALASVIASSAEAVISSALPRAPTVIHRCA